MTVIDLLDGALSQYLMLYTRFADEKFSSVFYFLKAVGQKRLTLRGTALNQTRKGNNYEKAI